MTIPHRIHQVNMGGKSRIKQFIYGFEIAGPSHRRASSPSITELTSTRDGFELGGFRRTIPLESRGIRAQARGCPLGRGIGPMPEGVAIAPSSPGFGWPAGRIFRPGQQRLPLSRHTGGQNPGLWRFEIRTRQPALRRPDTDQAPHMGPHRANVFGLCGRGSRIALFQIGSRGGI